jgi:hypothetical protein
MSPRLVQVGPRVPPAGLRRALEGARPAGPSRGLPGQACRDTETPATPGGQFFMSPRGHFPMSLDRSVGRPMWAISCELALVPGRPCDSPVALRARIIRTCRPAHRSLGESPSGSDEARHWNGHSPLLRGGGVLGRQTAPLVWSRRPDPLGARGLRPRPEHDEDDRQRDGGGVLVLPTCRRSRLRRCCGRCCSRPSIRCPRRASSWNSWIRICCTVRLLALGWMRRSGDPTVFTKNRDWLLEGEVAAQFFQVVLGQPEIRALLSDEHFSVDGLGHRRAWGRAGHARSPDGPALRHTGCRQDLRCGRIRHRSAGPG